MKQTPNKNFLNIVNLFGDMEEAFYQLGLRDSSSAKMACDHVISLISTPWKSVNLLAHKVLENFFNQILYKDPEFEALLLAYSEGSGLTPKEFLHSLLVPEMCAFLSKWLPKISTLQFGCSSLFTVDDNGNPIHTRILDFPLSGTYDKNERILNTSFKGKLKVINFSTIGLPFSGLTAMNEHGLSLALHQKFSDSFNQHGTPVFYLAHELIHNCANTQEALEFLEQSQSITCWNFNLMDSKGNVLEADLDGKQLKHKTYNVHQDGPIYVCNELLDKKQDQTSFYPQGIHFYNEARKDTAKKLIRKLHGMKHQAIIREFASPVKGRELSPITLSSMACVSFSPVTEEILYVNTEAPKIYQGSISQISKLWSSPLQVEITSKCKQHNLQLFSGLKYLGLAQSCFDKGEIHECYHNLQMAIEELKDPKFNAIGRFYFIVLQYINENHNISLCQIQGDLFEVYEQLPPYLRDVAKIIDQRLGILTDNPPLISKTLNSQGLTKRYEKEKNFNKVIHKTLKHLTFIHIDILDVIFA